jgi:FeS assembly protein IscX
VQLTWNDGEEIGYRLAEIHSGTNPLSLSFTKLREMVLQLEGFDDDPKASDEGKLEAIQMAWYEEKQ